jgi:hypothetical protein
MLKRRLRFDFVSDDIAHVQFLSDLDEPDPDEPDDTFKLKSIMLDFSRPVFWKDKEAIGIPLPWGATSGVLEGSRIYYEGRTLIDANTFQRLKPPVGRKYHPGLAKLAPDGRFFENLDTVTERELPLYRDDWDDFAFNSYGPGFGQFSIASSWRHQWQLYILPNPDKLNIPPKMLELWAQVVVGGELNLEGSFQPWDEPTLTAKQKELAAMKPPYADFPFPGWAATEPHLWWRVRANELNEGKEQDKLIDEWRRRSGRIRPKPEPDTWRTPEPKREVAPMPREKK